MDNRSPHFGRRFLSPAQVQNLDQCLQDSGPELHSLSAPAGECLLLERYGRPSARAYGPGCRES